MEKPIEIVRPKIYAVIQGPVTSVGRTFETTAQISGAKKAVDESKVVVNFDSSETIISNIKILRSLGVKVIYSGWSNDCSSDLQNRIKDSGAVLILSNPNDAPSFKEINSPFKGVLSINNKAKQFFTVLMGALSIPDLKNSIVIKLRSDMSLDVGQVLNEIKKNVNKIMKGAILIQYLKTKPVKNSKTAENEMPILWFPDFWFAGRGDVLLSISKDLVDRSLHNRSYNDSPHVDLGNAIIKYHFPNFPKLKKNEESIQALLKKFRLIDTFVELLNRAGRFILEQKMNSLFKSGLLITAPKHIQHSIVWRGDSYGRFAKIHPEIDDSTIYGKA